VEKHHEKHGFKPEWITEVKTTIGKEGEVKTTIGKEGG
jgi:hypothetical protein